MGWSRHCVTRQMTQDAGIYMCVCACALQIQCDLYGRMLYDGTLSLLVLPVVNTTSRVIVSVAQEVVG